MITEIQFVLADGKTIGWPIAQEAEALAWRELNAPGCVVNYITE